MTTRKTPEQIKKERAKKKQEIEKHVARLTADYTKETKKLLQEKQTLKDIKIEFLKNLKNLYETASTKISGVEQLKGANEKIDAFIKTHKAKIIKANKLLAGYITALEKHKEIVADAGKEKGEKGQDMLDINIVSEKILKEIKLTEKEINTIYAALHTLAEELEKISKTEEIEVSLGQILLEESKKLKKYMDDLMDYLIKSHNLSESEWLEIKELIQ